MSRPDGQTREILAITRENPHLAPKEIAARVGCPRAEVSDVLQRYDDVEAVDRALQRTGVASDRSEWILVGVIGTTGLAVIGLSGGQDAPLSALLLGIALLSVAIAAHSWR